MFSKILLSGLIITAAASCSTAYKSGQTPDDVYYSPARPAVIVEEKVDNRPDTRNEGRYYSYRDRQILMGIYDPRWRYFNDDYHSFYDPYRYGYNCGYYYNPYYYPSPVFISGAAIINPKNRTPRMANLGSYNYSNMVVVNPKAGSSERVRSTRVYNNNNSDKYIRRVMPPAQNNSNNSFRNENNTRSYNPSSNSPSSSPSRSGSSGTPVSRPGRRG